MVRRAERPKRGRLSVQAVTALIVFVAGSFSIVGTIVVNYYITSPSKSSLTSIGLATIAISIAGLSAGLGWYATQSRASVSRIGVNVALAGSPGAGKTVFANVLASYLSQGNSGTLRFTPETVTAQYVFRAMQGLHEGEWPPATDKERIRRYTGVVRLNQVRPLSVPSSLKRVIRRQSEYKLELADVAGENWAELAREERGETTPILMRSTLFQYLVEDSEALLYLVPADDILRHPRAVAKQLLDLSSTMILLRSLAPSEHPIYVELPIALVVSKTDLLDRHQYAIMAELLATGNSSRAGRREVIRAGEAANNSMTPEFMESLDIVGEMLVALGRQARTWRAFLVSSLLSSGLRRLELMELIASASDNNRPSNDSLSGSRTKDAEAFADPVIWLLSNF